MGIRESLEQLKQALRARTEVHAAALYGSYLRRAHRPRRSDIQLPGLANLDLPREDIARVFEHPNAAANRVLARTITFLDHMEAS